MLKIEEFLDIEQIEKIRKECLNAGLDEFDNFSYHIALKDENHIYGTARLYRKDGSLILDNIALEKGSPDSYYEMLYRALLLKAIDLDCKYIEAKQEREKEFYLKFGFSGELKAERDKIVFPKMCGK